MVPRKVPVFHPQKSGLMKGQEKPPKKTRKGGTEKNMSREKQRRNRGEKIRREKMELLEAFMAGKKIRKENPWINHEGYSDPTAYLAIRNVEELHT